MASCFTPPAPRLFPERIVVPHFYLVTGLPFSECYTIIHTIVDEFSKMIRFVLHAQAALPRASGDNLGLCFVEEEKSTSTIDCSFFPTFQGEFSGISISLLLSQYKLLRDIFFGTFIIVIGPCLILQHFL